MPHFWMWMILILHFQPRFQFRKLAHSKTVSVAMPIKFKQTNMHSYISDLAATMLWTFRDGKKFQIPYWATTMELRHYLSSFWIFHGLIIHVEFSWLDHTCRLTRLNLKGNINRKMDPFGLVNIIYGSCVSIWLIRGKFRIRPSWSDPWVK